MPSVVEDFKFIAARANEIRAARYHELGVSPPALPEEPQAPAQQTAAAPTRGDGFKYAPGFEYLAQRSTPTDDWDCCFQQPDLV